MEGVLSCHILSQIIQPTNSFTITSRIDPISVKVFHRPITSLLPEQTQALSQHVAFLKGYKHPHLASVIGGGTDVYLRVFFVTSRCGIPLDDLLSTEALPWVERIQIATDIANGIQYGTASVSSGGGHYLTFRVLLRSYLHCLKTLHGNLHPNNCIVTSERRAKVSDFGMLGLAPFFQLRDVSASNNQSSTESSSDSNASSRTYPVLAAFSRWVAPELLDQNEKFLRTFAIDTYRSVRLC